jgi:hypothetical protein
MKKAVLNVAHIESKTPTPGDTFGVVRTDFLKFETPASDRINRQA